MGFIEKIKTMNEGIQKNNQAKLRETVKKQIRQTVELIIKEYPDYTTWCNNIETIELKANVPSKNAKEENKVAAALFDEIKGHNRNLSEPLTSEEINEILQSVITTRGEER